MSVARIVRRAAKAGSAVTAATPSKRPPEMATNNPSPSPKKRLSFQSPGSRPTQAKPSSQASTISALTPAQRSMSVICRTSVVRAASIDILNSVLQPLPQEPSAAGGAEALCRPFASMWRQSPPRGEPHLIYVDTIPISRRLHRGGWARKDDETSRRNQLGLIAAGGEIDNDGGDHRLGPHFPTLTDQADEAMTCQLLERS
jgi:hypothetical protein